MKQSKFTDADIWLAVAVQAVNGLTSPAIGGSDTSIANVVDTAGRIADAMLVKFRAAEAALETAAEQAPANGGTQAPASHMKK